MKQARTRFKDHNAQSRHEQTVRTTNPFVRKFDIVGSLPKRMTPENLKDYWRTRAPPSVRRLKHHEGTKALRQYQVD